MAIFKNIYKTGLFPYKCPCCHKEISINNHRVWEESFSETSSGLGTSRGRMVVRTYSKTNNYTEYVCEKCYKALRRNDILITIIVLLILVFFIVLLFVGKGVWKTTGIVGTIAFFFLLTIDSHLPGELICFLLKPILGPYRVHFLGEDPLMSKKKKLEYKRINEFSLSLIKYLSNTYKVNWLAAYSFLEKTGDFIQSIHSDPSLLNLPPDKFIKKVFSGIDIAWSIHIIERELIDLDQKYGFKSFNYPDMKY